MATIGLDGKGGPWEWRSRVVFFCDDDEGSTKVLDNALNDPELIAAGYAVHDVVPVDSAAGEYGRRPIVTVLFRRRRKET